MDWSFFLLKKRIHDVQYEGGDVSGTSLASVNFSALDGLVALSQRG